MRSIDDLQQAAKWIEENGVRGLPAAERLVGSEAALGMVIMSLRAWIGAPHPGRCGEDLDDRVREFLGKECPDLFRNLSRPVALFYMDPWYCFDNFSQFTVTWDGRTAPTAEHHYQAAKYDRHQGLATWVYAARSAHEAKARGNEPRHANAVREDWDHVKLGVMRSILRAKYEQHHFVRVLLREVFRQGRSLIENSPTDGFWGRGPDWRGQNWVGRIWQEIGEEQALLGWPGIDD